MTFFLSIHLQDYKIHLTMTHISMILFNTFFFSSEFEIKTSTQGDGMPCWTGMKSKCCKGGTHNYVMNLFLQQIFSISPYAWLSYLLFRSITVNSLYSKSLIAFCPHIMYYVCLSYRKLRRQED